MLGEAAFGLGEALFCKLRLASCDLGLFLEGLALFGKASFGELRLAFADLCLASGGLGDPYGTYPRGDAAQRYDQRE